MPDNKFKLTPQVNISRATTVRMWLVIFCTFLAVMQSAAGDSGASLLVAFTTLITAVMVELLLTYSRHGFGKIKDGSAAVSALVLALLLPHDIRPMYAAMGAAFAVVVVKYSFGGLGSNWLNPALGGWLFVRLAWPLAFAGTLESPGAYSPESASVTDQAVGGFLNRVVLPFFDAELPVGYIDLFSLNTPGIIADRAGLAIVFGICLLVAFQVSRSWLSILYLAVFGLLVRMLGALPVSGAWWNGDVIYAMLSGGTLVAAFILIADPSSGAKSTLGKALLVVVAAVLGVIFRFFGNAFYGCFLAVALANTLAPLLCKAERMLLYAANEGLDSTEGLASEGDGRD